MTTDALVTILLAVGSWVVSGTITYGFMKAKIAEFERRLNAVEEDHRELAKDFVEHRIASARGRHDG